MKKRFRRQKRQALSEMLELPGTASSLLGESALDSSETQAGLQRNLEPDDFDAGTDVADDRIRGAGGQSLADLVINRDQGWGLEEHGGGLRHDRPEPTVNDLDLDEASEVDLEDDTRIAG